MNKAEIIQQLQRSILPLQGCRTSVTNHNLNLALGPIKYAFPNYTFPLGAVHEFLHTQQEDIAATMGFVSVLLSSIMRGQRTVLWISSQQNIFPPALTSFGIAPERVIFLTLKKQKQILWAMEEALKCSALAAVVAITDELSFTTSRRLQLAVESSMVTGFVIRPHQKNLSTTSCVTRWQIKHLPTVAVDDLPGVGFPRWNIELLKVRNGKPGSWQVEWAEDKLRHISKVERSFITHRKVV